jgi:Fe2+ transport system protein FeoA
MKRNENEHYCSRGLCPFFESPNEGDCGRCNRHGENSSPLDSLQLGAFAQVTFLCSKNKAAFSKMIAFGITKGTRVKLVARAPLGDPLVVKIRGYTLSLRREEAHLIECAPLHHE